MHFNKLRSCLLALALCSISMNAQINAKVVNTQNSSTSSDSVIHITATPAPGSKGDTSSTNDAYSIYVGPYLAFGGGGINTMVPNGRRTDVNFVGVPEYGGTILVPFNRTGSMGFGLSIGMQQYTYLAKPSADQIASGVSNDKVTIIEKYNFLSIFPHLNLAGFVIGFGFESAQSGSAFLKSGEEVNVLRDTSGNSDPAHRNGNGGNGGTTNPALGTDKSRLGLYYVGTAFFEQTPKYEDVLSSIVALKLGADVALYDGNWGRVNLRVMASYPLGSLYSDARHYLFADDFNSGTHVWTYNADNNPHPVSLSIGTSVFFKIPVMK